MSELLEKFDSKINEFLDECSASNTPTVCNFISTPKGRDKVHKLIQKKVINQNITIGQAIVEIEREFNVNSYTD